MGEGEWAAVTHGGNGRRGWKKLHLGVDETGVIVARALTEPTADDAITGISLVEHVDRDLTRVTADPGPTTPSASTTRPVREAHGSWCRRPRPRLCLAEGPVPLVAIVRSGG